MLPRSPGSTPINGVYGDDPLGRVWFFNFFVIDRVSISRFVSSRFEFRVIVVDWFGM